MTYGVQLLDIHGHSLGEPRDLIRTATPFLGRILGKDLPGVTMRLVMMPVPGYDNNLPGTPYLHYNTEGISYAYVLLEHGGRWIYRHPHPIGEILELGLRSWLQESEAVDSVAGYRLTGPDIADLQGRAKPVVAGVTMVDPYAPGEKPAFRIRPLPPPQPKVKSLSDFGAKYPSSDEASPGRTGFVKVLMDPGVQEELTISQPFSPDVEEGGFLIGRVYEDGDDPGTYITHVTAALPAQQTGASLLHFTFTGDSFDQFRKVMGREYPGNGILGWYHTHLFPATSYMGLSTIDYRLHFNTFRLPWQLAGLVNLDRNDRVLRYYVRREDDMVLCGHQPVRKETKS